MVRWLVMGLVVAGSMGCSTGDDAQNLDDANYWANARPVLDQHCTRCHAPGGQGTGDFTDPEVAKAFSSIMLDRVTRGEMPPPAADPGCRDYVGSEYLHVNDQAKYVLQAWVDNGSPEGDVGDYTPVAGPKTELDDADFEIFMEHAYTPTFSDESQPGNEYRCFFLEHGRTDDFYITGLSPLVDATSIVHHVVIGTASRGNVPSNYDPTMGVNCINGGDGADAMIGGWAPGMLPTEFPAGEGIKVGANDLITVQMHYYESYPGEAIADQSGYAFRTADSVTKEVRMVPFGPTGFRIPAGEVYSDSQSAELPIPVTVYGTFPHMHVLGAGYRIWVEHTDGTETCAASSENYSFHNQVSYLFREPMLLSAGDVVHVECTWDNTTANSDRIHDEPRTTYYGERTDEEMCWAFTMVGLGH